MHDLESERGMATADPTQMIMGALWANGGLLAFIGVMFVLLGVLKAFLPRIKGWAGERAVKDALDRAGFRHLHDVYLPSKGGVTQIDHIVLAGGAIVVVETKNYSGWIFGEEKQGRWTVSLAGGRSKHSFQNPLRQNHGHIRSVESALDRSAPVTGLVAFTAGSHFPKGMPPGVIRVSGLATALRQIAKDTPADRTGEAAWRKLESLAQGTDRKAAKGEHMRTVKAAQARGERTHSRAR
jgi:restriction system protein